MSFVSIICSSHHQYTSPLVHDNTVHCYIPQTHKSQWDTSGNMTTQYWSDKHHWLLYYFSLPVQLIIFHLDRYILLTFFTQKQFPSCNFQSIICTMYLRQQSLYIFTWTSHVPLVVKYTFMATKDWKFYYYFHKQKNSIQLLAPRCKKCSIYYFLTDPL